MRARVKGTRPMLTMESRAASRPVVSMSMATRGTSAMGVSGAGMPAAQNFASSGERAVSAQWAR